MATRDRSAGPDRPAPENPKLRPAGDAGNRIKDPDDWVTGSEPMTEAQASYLKTLSEQTHEPESFDPTLDKAEASRRIDSLKQERNSSG
jgi:hypothetical protein